MKNVYKWFGIAALFATIGILTIACDDGGGVRDPDPLTFSGEADGVTYTLIITQNPNNRAFEPQRGDHYELTANLDRSEGEVVSFTNGSFSLMPENSTTPFTASVSNNGISGFTGSVTWESGTVVTLPTAVTPASPPSPGDGGGTVTSDGRLRLYGNVYTEQETNTGINYTRFTGNRTVSSNLDSTGTIRNGQLNITIERPSDNQLNGDLDDFFHGFGVFYKDVTLSDPNVRFVELDLYTDVSSEFLWSGNHSGTFAGNLTQDLVLYIYVDRAVTVTGTGTSQNITNLNLSLGQGWNAIHRRIQEREEITDTMSISVANPSGVRWVLGTEENGIMGY